MNSTKALRSVYKKIIGVAIDMDKMIRKIENTNKKEGKDLKKLEKADKKRDKECEMGKKMMTKKGKR